MILLDTDHISVLEVPSSDRRTRLVARLAQAAAEGGVIGTTVVTVEEQMRGWLASIAKERQAQRQVNAYRHLARLFAFFQPFHLALFDEATADLFYQFGRIRIGTPDKKIAAVARANNALLLTANRRDSEQIPGLQFANWMDPPVG
ncbi:type II toxin-antitoxin system VapC family toxin [Gemmata sp. JC717]|uniref:type II toxin-antitoxin system VapC family toxin n=1 Tax=Gemmata algarum TaxID=2975278 RepID=UPI0021BBA643|nr:type II toxin-antitoxin system VapC family toxin [Gemmata algarum]MDY3556338.1 type II toxin-antitoxin system VapC family toxin [Gemmata algarum]